MGGEGGQGEGSQLFGCAQRGTGIPRGNWSAQMASCHVTGPPSEDGSDEIGFQTRIILPNKETAQQLIDNHWWIQPTVVY